MKYKIAKESDNDLPPPHLCIIIKRDQDRDREEDEDGERMKMGRTDGWWPWNTVELRRLMMKLKDKCLGSTDDPAAAECQPTA
jgi:hypothetical protein